MAKITTGPIVAEIRGKIADVVFTRNRGGMVSQSLGVRVKPWSAHQDALRIAAQIVGLRWNANLTQEQRTGWNALALTVEHHDQLRQRSQLSGQNLHMRHNFPLYWHLGAFLDDPPADLFVGATPEPTIVEASTPPDLLTISCDRTPAANEIFTFKATKPMHPGVSAYERRLSYLGYLDSTVTWPADLSTEYAATRGPLTAGQILAITVRVLNTDNGVLSRPRSTVATIAPPGDAMLVTTLTLTDAEIKALPTTPIQIIASPGPGKLILPWALAVDLDTSGDPYTNIDPTFQDLRVTYSLFDANLIFGPTDDISTTPALNDFTVMFAGGGRKFCMCPQNYNAAPTLTIRNTPPLIISALADSPLHIWSFTPIGQDLAGGDPANSMNLTLFYSIVDV